MDAPKFVYVTYIETTPEKLWNALLDGEMTRQYWFNHRNVSDDWKPGSPWQHADCDDPTQVHAVGRVVAHEPPRRLVLTWADPSDAADERKHSRVTFEIEKQSGSVRLTVLHEELEPDSAMLRGVSSGWPAVLSSLKTLLETGRPMQFPARHQGA
jgi:uncharacterized protein YndB with AHSA1/START domain